MPVHFLEFNVHACFKCLMDSLFWTLNCVQYKVDNKCLPTVMVIVLACCQCLVAMENMLAGHYEFLNYQTKCIYKMALHSINTIATVLNHISLDRAGHQYSDKVCGVCITSLDVELRVCHFL